MPFAQFAKSTACIPSTLTSRTRLMWPLSELPSWLFDWELSSWAIAVPTAQVSARRSTGIAFFIVTSGESLQSVYSARIAVTLKSVDNRVRFHNVPQQAHAPSKHLRRL